MFVLSLRIATAGRPAKTERATSVTGTESEPGKGDGDGDSKKVSHL